jgi:hypothetical protein
MSDLRTRIADALKKQAEFRGVYKIADFDYRFLADAVIRDLGLRQQWRAKGNSCVEPQESREDALLYGDTTERRFVTDWEAE